ncbi:MAG: bifunctional ADP-dependent NAD(P)H-hydrate dehydratase/NAD(P)H-hydrate epimerase [Coxiellaceae bacterium]|nr:bifunctional ADP-dependent NAD(P)H-hydrate dehydratase/NAD(P)H-hydrate epimerase [Coxiellaceae bacterium]|tara:strand:+ start:4207 stop:5676 length:1470 start_codon:yes stop_codon:yes gene_type:complete
MTALYDTQGIRALEDSLVLQQATSLASLMQQAGAAAWQCLKKHWPHCRTIAVCCGKGNNGGDGFVLARCAHEAGCSVVVYALAMPEHLTGIAQEAALACRQAGVEIQPYSYESILIADVIVDAVLGIGCNRPLMGDYLSVVNAMNHSQSPVFSLDIPSGLNADTGGVLTVAVDARATITFLAIKSGLVTGAGLSQVGQLFVEPLITTETLVRPSGRLMHPLMLEAALPRRRRDTHKGDFGHVLIIGGDHGMGGAVLMAAEAAMRVGAGLVTVASRPEHLAVVTGARPEIMCRSVETADDLLPLIEKATVIVIGPGLGQSDWSLPLMHCVQTLDIPMVVDADALNLLANARVHNDRWILTPHPGEAGRLLSVSSIEVQSDRYSAAKKVCDLYGGVTVLKGGGTVIQSPAEIPVVCSAGNPGMSSGGMGDVLSGILGGLLAQGLSSSQAAEVGVMVHAMAGDKAADRGGERGLLASDVLNQLRTLVNPDAH